jgi:hypothetical protein
MGISVAADRHFHVYRHVPLALTRIARLSPGTEFTDGGRQAVPNGRRSNTTSREFLLAPGIADEKRRRFAARTTIGNENMGMLENELRGRCPHHEGQGGGQTCGVVKHGRRYAHSAMGGRVDATSYFVGPIELALGVVGIRAGRSSKQPNRDSATVHILGGRLHTRCRMSARAFAIYTVAYSGAGAAVDTDRRMPTLGLIPSGKGMVELAAWHSRHVLTRTISSGTLSLNYWTNWRARDKKWLPLFERRTSSWS